MLLPLLSLLSSTSLVAAVINSRGSTAQTPFVVSSTSDDFVLAALSENVHTQFAHESFPDHKIRIKATEGGWCDPGVKSYTG